MLHFLSTPPVVYYSTLRVSCTCVPPGGAIHQCATPHGIHDLTTRHECFGTDMDGDGRERDCRAYTLACPFVLSHQTPLLVHCITPAVLQLPYLPAWETHSQQCYIFLRSLLEALYTGESSPQDTGHWSRNPPVVTWTLETGHWRVVSSGHSAGHCTLESRLLRTLDTLCRPGLPLLHHSQEAITGGTTDLQGKHLLHELVVGTICVGLGLRGLLHMQLSLVCLPLLLESWFPVELLWWAPASECATCAPGLVLSLGLLWCAGTGSVWRIPLKAHSQGELAQLGLLVSDHWTLSSFALGGCAEQSRGHGTKSAMHWTLYTGSGQNGGFTDLDHEKQAECPLA